MISAFSRISKSFIPFNKAIIIIIIIIIIVMIIIKIIIIIIIIITPCELFTPALADRFSIESE